MSPRRSPELEFQGFWRLPDSNTHVLVRMVVACDERIALVIAPSDCPGRGPVNDAERLLAELAQTPGGPPTRVFVTFPMFGRDEWIEFVDGDGHGPRLPHKHVVKLAGEHATLPPADACRCVDLAPGDPLLEFLPRRGQTKDGPTGHGFAVVDVAALPWPHWPFKCEHKARFLELEDHYPKNARYAGVVGAHWSSTLTADDIAGCPRHGRDLAGAAAVTAEILESMPESSLDELVAELGRRKLDHDTAELALDFFIRPISWAPGAPKVDDGQHRLCALRFAGAPRVVVDVGEDNPKLPATRVGTIAERAAAAIDAYHSA